ncbi:MAG: hypothetical protein M1825_004909 [Sarcosagium campestre]|nr:MAG: hypothetical protein M1825_004909 [Sarcosagium campestre]
MGLPSNGYICQHESTSSAAYFGSNGEPIRLCRYCHLRECFMAVEGYKELYGSYMADINGEIDKTRAELKNPTLSRDRIFNLNIRVSDLQVHWLDAMQRRERARGAEWMKWKSVWGYFSPEDLAQIKAWEDEIRPGIATV